MVFIINLYRLSLDFCLSIMFLTWQIFVLRGVCNLKLKKKIISALNVVNIPQSLIVSVISETILTLSYIFKPPDIAQMNFLHFLGH